MAVYEPCLTSRTRFRQLVIRLAPSKPPRWLSAMACWRIYSILEWAALRMQDLAMAIEDYGKEA